MVRSGRARPRPVEDVRVRFDSNHVIALFYFVVTPEIIKQEFEMIEKQQQQIDKEAKILEKRLHKLMSIDGNKKLEEKLTQNWFILINKRNELVRKEMRLNIL